MGSRQEAVRLRRWWRGSLGYIKEPQFNYWDSWGVTERPERVTGRFASAQRRKSQNQEGLEDSIADWNVSAQV